MRISFEVACGDEEAPVAGSSDEWFSAIRNQSIWSKSGKVQLKTVCGQMVVVVVLRVICRVLSLHLLHVSSHIFAYPLASLSGGFQTEDLLALISPLSLSTPYLHLCQYCIYISLVESFDTISIIISQQYELSVASLRSAHSRQDPGVLEKPTDRQQWQ